MIRFRICSQGTFFPDPDFFFPGLDHIFCKINGILVYIFFFGGGGRLGTGLLKSDPEQRDRIHHTGGRPTKNKKSKNPWKTGKRICDMCAGADQGKTRGEFI